ncbi:mitochondrial inner membrane protein OXA1L-like [Brevipalpus obovatus]|uniref:mitochondrial inner membrane protein OXA1L-like n=1 Tax=Brevipalpus obovatus TaxID=246614 RepID=UPI003D9F28D9
MNTLVYRLIVPGISRESQSRLLFSRCCNRQWQRKLSIKIRREGLLITRIVNHNPFNFGPSVFCSSLSGTSNVESLNPLTQPMAISEITEEIEKLSSESNLLLDSESKPISSIDISEFTTDPAATISENLLTASDIGLTWWCPPNLVFQALMGLHDYLPWVGAIAATAIISRTIAFPLMIKNQKTSTTIAENYKSISKSLEEFKKAKMESDQVSILMAANKYVSDTTKMQLATIKMFIPMGGLAVIFTSNFFAIRAMATYQIPSMKDGGFLWFQNLVAADPYYILPLLTALTTYAVIKTGAEGPPDPRMAQALRFLPHFLCPLIFIGGTMFPAALNVYWLINNTLSLVQVSLLRTQRARNYFGIKQQKPNPSMQTTLMATKNELEDALRIINNAIKNTPRGELIQKLGKLKKEEKK